MLGTLAFAGLGYALLRSNPAKRRRRARRNPPVAKPSTAKAAYRLGYAEGRDETGDLGRRGGWPTPTDLGGVPNKLTIAWKKGNDAGIAKMRASRSNPKKAKRRGGRPRGWKAVSGQKTASGRWVVQRPKGRWKPTGRMRRSRYLDGHFGPRHGTTWVQQQRQGRQAMRVISEVLREESGRQKLRPGRGRNRRNPNRKKS